MEIVIDANIINGFYKEDVLGIPSTLTGSVVEMFTRSQNQGSVICLDEGGQIESEWRNVVPDDWFDVWYSKLLVEDKAIIVPVHTCHQLLNQLWRLGFPRSRDKWYIRTAKTVVDYKKGQDEDILCVLITEDLDFYDPSKKKTANAQQRVQVLKFGRGCIADKLYLESILVTCVQNLPKETS